tara:strand:+ start:586 stop:1581 length:996 start_codon:yes stop_codon:yes gene_type:complete
MRTGSELIFDILNRNNIILSCNYTLLSKRINEFEERIEDILRGNPNHIKPEEMILELKSVLEYSSELTLPDKILTIYESQLKTYLKSPIVIPKKDYTYQPYFAIDLTDCSDIFKMSEIYLNELRRRYYEDNERDFEKLSFSFPGSFQNTEDFPHFPPIANTLINSLLNKYGNEFKKRSRQLPSNYPLKLGGTVKLHAPGSRHGFSEWHYDKNYQFIKMILFLEDQNFVDGPLEFIPLNNKDGLEMSHVKNVLQTMGTGTLVKYGFPIGNKSGLLNLRHTGFENPTKKEIESKIVLKPAKLTGAIFQGNLILHRGGRNEKLFRPVIQSSLFY